MGTVVTALSVPAFYWWAVPHGALGIALLSSLGVVVYIALLCALWCKRYGAHAFKGVGKQSALVTAFALPASLIAYAAGEWCMAALPLSPVLNAFVALAVSGLLFAVCYIAPAWKWAPQLLEPLLGRLRRHKAA